MLTVTQLARKCGISRTAVLYYERIGLLKPSRRSANGYRWYDEGAIKRLEAIIGYRSFGVALQEIPLLLAKQGSMAQQQILQRQFNTLEQEIQRLRLQQRAIMKLLEQPQLLEENMVTKQRWVEIMRAAGFSEQDMHNWHKQFEKMEPEAHQEFLESLSISSDEISKIRAWSK
ncbi:MerR family DNA-binding transcriptional regulator [Dongshaea marina]|uniref:MerR family DNA-binding transcriptional regulator n=1 Tax=Dongshaea marina TaxID=2047966 RepID=UPI000D3E0EF0|nr:MerR family DNA-binding transcriptional regulator [Dongshaea marina]